MGSRIIAHKVHALISLDKTLPMPPITTVSNNISFHINNPKTTPIVVATPLPPVNLRKILQLCPATKATHIATINHGSGYRYRTKIIGTVPLQNASKIPINNPNLFPEICIMLEDPTLPEPYLRISIPCKSLPAIYDVGIEPTIKLHTTSAISTNNLDLKPR